MNPEQMNQVAGFASALLKLRDARERGQDAQLTAEEVAGIIWGVQQLRGGAEHGPADQPS